MGEVAHGAKLLELQLLGRRPHGSEHSEEFMDDKSPGMK
jgi:hypothetical protein